MRTFVLLADKDELARRGWIVVAQEVMDPEPKVVQADSAATLERHELRRVPIAVLSLRWLELQSRVPLADPLGQPFDPLVELRVVD